MAKAYTPGLKVAASTAYQAHRVLPIPGTLRVAAGDVVEADTIGPRPSWTVTSRL